MLANANMPLCSILCVVVGYLIGCISFGYLVGKKKHVDIGSQGSGNLGATNALRTTGIKGGIATLAGDLLKALIPTLLVKFWLFSGLEGQAGGLYSTDYFVLITGIGIVLGHDFPFWRHFKGGKGISSSGGLLFVLNFPFTCLLAVILVLVVAITRYVSLASICAAITVIIGGFVCYPGQWVINLLCLFLGLLAITRHHANISRLLHGTENKFSLKKKMENKA